MFFDFTVEIPDVKGKIIQKKHADTTYVNYEYDRIYLPEKQYTIPKRTTIGEVYEDEPLDVLCQKRYNINTKQRLI